MYNASFIILSQQQLHLQQSLQFYETSTPREQSSTAQAAPSYPDPSPNDSLLQYQKQNLKSYQCLHQLARSSKLLTAMNPDRESQPLHSGNHLQPAWKVLEPSHCQQNGMTKYETTKWDKQNHQKNNKSHKNRKITKSKKKYKNLKKNYKKAIETT